MHLSDCFITQLQTAPTCTGQHSSCSITIHCKHPQSFYSVYLCCTTSQQQEYFFIIFGGHRSFLWGNINPGLQSHGGSFTCTLHRLCTNRYLRLTSCVTPPEDGYHGQFKSMILPNKSTHKLKLHTRTHNS